MPIVAVTDASRVPDGTACATDLEGLVAHLRAVRPGEDSVLVSHTERGEALARAARLACGERSVGLLHVPSTATAFFASIGAVRLLPQECLGLGGVVASILSSTMWTRVVLRRLGEPGTPVPTFSQRLRGAFPGARFVVDPVSGVVEPTKELVAPQGVIVLTASSAPATRPDSRIDLTAGGAYRYDLDLGSDGWRARRWTEATVLTRQVEDVVHHSLQPSSYAYYSTCAVCGRIAWGERCIFCQVPLLVRDDLAVQTIGGIQ